MTTVRRVLIGLGTLLIAYAILGAVFDPDLKLFGVLIFLIAVLAAHDGILLPAYLGAGALIGRLVPARLRTPVRVGLVISLAVTLVALPSVLGFGRSADNPSILPLQYGRGLLGTLALIWSVTAATVAIRARRSNTRAKSVPTEQSGPIGS